MSGIVLLDVAIGLVFTYLILSMICSGIIEMIAAKFGWRGKYLVTGLENILKDQKIRDPDGSKTALSSAILAHPHIKSLKRGDKSPSYVPAETFTAVRSHPPSSLRAHSPRPRASKPTAAGSATRVEFSTSRRRSLRRYRSCQ